jgi:hypothetical protein
MADINAALAVAGDATRLAGAALGRWDRAALERA